MWPNLSQVIFKHSFSSDDLTRGPGTPLDMKSIVTLKLYDERNEYYRLAPLLITQKENWHRFCKDLSFCSNLTSLDLSKLMSWKNTDGYFRSFLGGGNCANFHQFFSEALRGCSKLTALIISETRADEASLDILNYYKGAFDSVSEIHFSADEVDTMSVPQINAWAALFPNAIECTITPHRTSPNIQQLQAKSQQNKMQVVATSIALYRVFQRTGLAPLMIIEILTYLTHNTSIGVPIASGFAVLMNPYNQFVREVSSALSLPNTSVLPHASQASYSNPLSYQLVHFKQIKPGENQEKAEAIRNILNTLENNSSISICSAKKTKLIKQGHDLLEPEGTLKLSQG